ncbi:methyltransferase type 11 [Neosynechococcus sphagnicola sy1]|uniref:Methyltransferase type 11 n=1 Tax=Neosynechococcus sphagnicola sy1 TaxID=1497020 RepID=A0A098TKJ6_9CYAN|nr:methyltransferase domain-containing protein [Neosynechococcus sphagnicola]KGF72860.1 methyltransferase type 11 [Neosynechococcus sphagnicola sy1]
MSTETIESSPLRLHIGGWEVHPNWKILDVEARPEVDFVCDASCLSQFADQSVDAIYSSHTLEHFYYGINNELAQTLKEWYRVLKVGGELYVSVPDLHSLCWLFLEPTATAQHRFDIMRIIYGGQLNPYDIHKVGFDIDILTYYLKNAGFREYMRVSEFDLFNDASTLKIKDKLISLNVIALK